jgi:hypothetical protein
MKSIYVCEGQEITSSNINKSLDERIAEGENELALTLKERQNLYANYDFEERRVRREIKFSYFKETLLINQLAVLIGMRDGDIVHKLPQHSSKIYKRLGRAWSADLVFDYLLECNHRQFAARGGWEAYKNKTRYCEEEIFELSVLLDF